MRNDFNLNAFVEFGHRAKVLYELVEPHAMRNQRREVVSRCLLLQDFEHGTPVRAAMEYGVNVQVLRSDVTHDVEGNRLAQVDPVPNFDHRAALADHSQRFDKDLWLSSRFNHKVRSNS